MKKHTFVPRMMALVLMLVAVASLVSCGGAAYDEVGNSGSDKAGYEEGISGTQGNILDENRKIIKTVNEYVDTENYDAFIESLQNSVTKAGGYISSSRYTGSGTDDIGNRTARFVIRIPAENLYDFTGEVGNLATVTSYEESQSDVTLAYVDITSRIEVLESERVALFGLLENSKTTGDILAIRSQLEDVQADLASLEAQKKVYDDQVSYSTANLYVYEVSRELPKSENNFFTRVGNAFMSSLRGVGKIISGLGIFLLGGSPYFVFIGVIVVAIVLIIRLAKKLGKKNKE